MIRFAAALIAVLCLASACDRPGVPSEAKQTADVLTGDAKGQASDNPQCKLFKPDELAAYIGEPVKEGTNAGMGTGCQWVARDGEGDVMVVVVPADYHTAPSGADGYRPLADLGDKAYVVPEMGGFAAAAISGAEGVKVSVAGDKASADQAVALLRETLKRRG